MAETGLIPLSESSATLCTGLSPTHARYWIEGRNNRPFTVRAGIQLEKKRRGDERLILIESAQACIFAARYLLITQGLDNCRNCEHADTVAGDVIVQQLRSELDA